MFCPKTGKRLCDGGGDHPNCYCSLNNQLPSTVRTEAIWFDLKAKLSRLSWHETEIIGRQLISNLDEYLSERNGNRCTFGEIGGDSISKRQSPKSSNNSSSSLDDSGLSSSPPVSPVIKIQSPSNDTLSPNALANLAIQAEEFKEIHQSPERHPSLRDKTPILRFQILPSSISTRKKACVRKLFNGEPVSEKPKLSKSCPNLPCVCCSPPKTSITASLENVDSNLSTAKHQLSAISLAIKNIQKILHKQNDFVASYSSPETPPGIDRANMCSSRSRDKKMYSSDSDIDKKGPNDEDELDFEQIFSPDDLTGDILESDADPEELFARTFLHDNPDLVAFLDDDEDDDKENVGPGEYSRVWRPNATNFDWNLNLNPNIMDDYEFNGPESPPLSQDSIDYAGLVSEAESSSFP